MPFACAGHCGLSLVALRRRILFPFPLKIVFFSRISMLLGLKALTALDRNGAQRACERARVDARVRCIRSTLSSDIHVRFRPDAADASQVGVGCARVSRWSGSLRAGGLAAARGGAYQDVGAKPADGLVGWAVKGAE